MVGFGVVQLVPLFGRVFLGCCKNAGIRATSGVPVPRRFCGGLRWPRPGRLEMRFLEVGLGLPDGSLGPLEHISALESESSFDVW